MPVSVPVSAASLFSGRARHAIDGSNRIMLPAGWRADGSSSQFFVVAALSGDHLVVCPPTVFEAFLEDLRTSVADKTEIPQLERELSDRVRQVSLDRFGRLPLPTDLMAQTGIAKQGQIIGRFSKFEIWACDKYDQLFPQQPNTSATLARKLSTL